MRAVGAPAAAYGDAVVTLMELRRMVDVAFIATSQGLDPWEDPHPDRSPLEEEYSRVLDPGKWRIVPARVEAWCDVLIEVGLATVERDVTLRWAPDRGRTFARIDRLVSPTPSTVPLVFAYFGFEGVDINAVTIAAGDPAVELTGVPPCGCDACDSGSQDALGLVDDHILGVVSGVFRHLTRGSRTITVHSADGWSASGAFDHNEVDRVLADPTGWDEVSGSPWQSAGGATQ